MTEEETSIFKIDQRVRTCEDLAFATVKYLGSVVGQKGSWVGVEWDDSTRGKHDGSYGGERYFVCTVGEEGGDASRAASFCRAAKLTPSVPLTRALTWRYTPQQQDQLHQGGGGMFVQSSSGQRVKVELVVGGPPGGGGGGGGGEGEGSQAPALCSVVQAGVQASCVDRVGPPGELGASVPALLELDLAGNLLVEWSSEEGGALQLARELPKLRMLNLSKMSLAWPAVPPAADTSFGQLTTLVLNNTGMQWSRVLLYSAFFPALTELHLCENGIQHLTAEQGVEPEECFPHLSVLNLDFNQISTWVEVVSLSTLPSLTRLMLSNNQLTHIGSPESTGAFSSLRSLLVGNNQLDDWSSVNAMAGFPALSEVRLTGNPLLPPGGGSGGPARVRWEVIARVPALSALNASPVTPLERKDAEIRYLRRLLDLTRGPHPSGTSQGGDCQQMGSGSGVTSEDAKAEVAKEHPRFHALLEKYGELAAGAENGAGPAGEPGSMGQELLTLTLRCVAASAGEKKEVVKKLPGSLTIDKLKLLCESLFKLSAGTQELFMQENESPIPQPLGEDREQLSQIGIQDGGLILVGARE